MSIPLKNTGLYSKIFSCLCASCREEFSIVVEPGKEGKAICPACGSSKIFIQNDGDKNGDFLFT